MGSLQPCRTNDTDCPSDGQFQYNTNIILDDKGILVGRYHKTAVYSETWFDKPEEYEYIYVDTLFGRIGTFVSLDILFENHAIDLVEKYGVNTIAFTAAWGNFIPFIDCVDFHESWAMRMSVNFLSANINGEYMSHSENDSLRKLTGSGIYSGAEGTVKCYENKARVSPKLVIAEIPTVAYKPTNMNTGMTYHTSHANNECQEFSGVITRDNYTLIQLCEKQSTASLRVNNLMCKVDYIIEDQLLPSRFYALAAFDGVSEKNSYIQVCAVVVCDSLAISDGSGLFCGHDRLASNVSYMALTGNYDTKYVFPSVRLPHGRLKNNSWTFRHNIQDQIFEITVQEKTLIQYVVLYGRGYTRDGGTDDGNNDDNNGDDNADNDDNDDAYGYSTPAPSSKSRLWLWVLAIVIVIIVCIILLCAKFKLNSDISEYLCFALDICECLCEVCFLGE